MSKLLATLLTLANHHKIQMTSIETNVEQHKVKRRKDGQIDMRTKFAKLLKENAALSN